MKRKNGFTLIELLAIIVILAIIAVITVPIILGIIEDASENAAKDSAYGFKDSVNKYYAQQLLNNQNLKLNDTYTVTNGTLSGGDFGDSNITSLPIQVSGTVPTSGTLTYSNNKLTSGCLKIGDYAVTFSGENVTSTEKGICQSLPTMAEMCPGCVFTFNEVDVEKYVGVDTVTNYETDYTKLNRRTFLGYILDENTHVIQKAFLCGINKSMPFCVEYASDNTKLANNVSILNKFFSNLIIYEDFYFFYDGEYNAEYGSFVGDDYFSFTMGFGHFNSMEEETSEYGSGCTLQSDGRTGCFSS